MGVTGRCQRSVESRERGLLLVGYSSPFVAKDVL